MSGKMTKKPDFLLQCFKFIPVPGLPIQVIKSKRKNTQPKRDQGKMFISKIANQRPGIKLKEFTDHPIGVGTDPDRDGQVMTEFRHVLSCSPGNNDGNNQGWKNHRNTQWPP